MKRLVEVCAGSYDDVIQAHLGGADRVELNSALFLGGLTPSVGSLVLAKRHTGMKIIAMVRPRGGGFHYEKADFACILEDVQIMLDHGADGIAFGCLTADGHIDNEQNRQIIARIKAAGKEAVFHRAFDCCGDPHQAMKELIQLGADRVLTSGLQTKAVDGKALLKELQDHYGDQIQILAGSGINASNAKILMDDTGITQVHSSCKAWKGDPTTTMNHVSYAYAQGVHQNDYEVVDASIVRELVTSIK